MEKELYSLADRIRLLRESMDLTQADLARMLGISRSGVNAWEMGLTVPSTPYIVELAKIFNISADYLLGIDQNATIHINGLSQKQVQVLMELVHCFKDDVKKDN